MYHTELFNLYWHPVDFCIKLRNLPWLIVANGQRAPAHLGYAIKHEARHVMGTHIPSSSRLTAVGYANSIWGTVCFIIVGVRRQYAGT